VEAFSEKDEEEVLIEIDGGQVGRLPVVFDIIPGGLLVKGYL
jgi:hypothetical protein